MKKTRAAAASASTPMKGKRPDGSISSGIYDAVEKLTADGKMTRTAAFRRIAKESGRKEGTVAVNYYYMARKRGAKLRRRGRPKSVASVRRNGKPSKIGSALQSLTELIRAQETELAGLRRENERFAEIKKLMGRA